MLPLAVCILRKPLCLLQSLGIVDILAMLGILGMCPLFGLLAPHGTHWQSSIKQA